MPRLKTLADLRFESPEAARPTGSGPLDSLYNICWNLYNNAGEAAMSPDGRADQRRKALAAMRNRAALESARAAGLLGGAKSARVAGRVPAELVAAAKKSAGLSSDTDLIEVALAKLAMEDDFGVKLMRDKGALPRDIDVEF